MKTVIRLLAALAITVGLVGVGGANTMFETAIARADSHTVMGNASHLDIAAIDPNQTGQLILVKIAGENPKPVPGAYYSIKRIRGIDLTTQEGWDTARDMTISDAIRAGVDYIDGGFTNADGEATFTDVPVGLYLIKEERHGPSTYWVRPFLLTIPSGSVDGASWEYNIKVNLKTIPISQLVDGVLFGWPPGGLHSDPSDPNSVSGNGGGGVPGAGGGAGATGPGQGADGVGNGTRPGLARGINLASTGAQVTGVLAIGAGLILGGWMLRRRRN